MGEQGMEEDGGRKEGAGWLRSPARLLCVRKQLWPTEDYITQRDTYAPACTYADAHTPPYGCVWMFAASRMWRLPLLLPFGGLIMRSPEGEGEGGATAVHLGP